MGLQEKRALKEFQENEFPKIESEIKTLAGFDLELDVKWENLTVEDYSHMYAEGFTKVYFEPIIGALKEITKDDLGKEGLKETLAKIVITNEGGFYSVQNAFTFSEKTFTFDHEPFSNIDNIEERTNGIANRLMKEM